MNRRLMNHVLMSKRTGELYIAYHNYTIFGDWMIFRRMDSCCLSDIDVKTYFVRLGYL